MPKKGDSLKVSKKVERGTFSTLEGFLKGFGRVQNEVISTFGQSAQKVHTERGL